MHGITRAQFLTGAIATGVGASALPANAAAPRRPFGLTYRGVGYEVADGETPYTSYNAQRMRHDLWTIRYALWASSVSVFGDGVERLRATAERAAQLGLHIWLQPRLGDRPENEILEHLAETGKAAERLRRQGARINLSVGCEFVLFVPGIVPGADALERIKNLLSGKYDRQQMQRRLDRFIRKAAAVGRSVFRGQISYAAAQDDHVDWRLFDIVGIDYYGYFNRHADYVRDLRQYRRFGKPVTIAECGSCTYKGAPQLGGMAWDAVDYNKDPQEVKRGLVRSEQTQARYIATMLSIFESMGFYSATVYEFITPDAPHLSQGRYDLDIASYGIVKPIWKSATNPGPHWHWEPKAAFMAIAKHYAQARWR